MIGHTVTLVTSDGVVTTMITKYMLRTKEVDLIFFIFLSYFYFLFDLFSLFYF